MNIEQFRAFTARWGDTARFMAGVAALVLAARGFVVPYLTPKPSGPVVIFYQDKSSIRATNVTKPLFMTLAYSKRRDDCPLTARSVLLTDAGAVVHDLLSSRGMSATPKSKSPTDINFTTHALAIENPKYVETGEVAVHGFVTYQCPEGSQTIQYPIFAFAIGDGTDRTTRRPQ